jgi:hypothetical protein
MTHHCHPLGGFLRFSLRGLGTACAALDHGTPQMVLSFTVLDGVRAIEKWGKSLRAQRGEKWAERLVKTEQNWGKTDRNQRKTEQNRGKQGWFEGWQF